MDAHHVTELKLSMTKTFLKLQKWLLVCENGHDKESFALFLAVIESCPSSAAIAEHSSN